MKFKCKMCGGSGQVENDAFEICKKMSKERREEYGIKIGECNNCPFYKDCHEGEYITCPYCMGKGYMEVDDEFWEVVKE